MTIDRRLIVGALGLTLVLGACGASTASPAASPAASAAPAASTAPTQAAAPTEAPTTEGTEATEAPSADSGTGGAPLNDLARLIPEQAGGVTFQRVGFDGDQLALYGAAVGLSQSQLDPILKANGKTINDVNFAIASTATGSKVSAMIYALQLEGVTATDMMASMNLDPAQLNKVTIGGKTAYAQGAGGFGVWAYPKDDKLFVILLTTEDVAKAVIEQLP